VSTTNTSALARWRLARGTDPIRRPTTELNPTLPTTMRSTPALSASFSSASTAEYAVGCSMGELRLEGRGPDGLRGGGRIGERAGDVATEVALALALVYAASLKPLFGSRPVVSSDRRSSP
jgi:hypothetical protein